MYLVYFKTLAFTFIGVIFFCISVDRAVAMIKFISNYIWSYEPEFTNDFPPFFLAVAIIGLAFVSMVIIFGELGIQIVEDFFQNDYVFYLVKYFFFLYIKHNVCLNCS